MDNEDVIQLRYNRFKTSQLTPLPPSLVVSNIPKQVSIQKVYTLFRKIGPIIQCVLIKEQGNKGINEVNIQYLSKSDSSQALSTYNNTNIEDNVITVSYGAVLTKNVNTRMIDNTNEITSTKKKPSKNTIKEQYRVEIKPSMDLCNLYIKGLPMTTTSTDLFNIFKPYGRIISAKVMENEKGKSKGFGFVSYSQSIESAAALISLHHYYDIQFHEPKVPRPDQDIVQQFWSLLNSSFRDYFYSITLPPLPHPSTASPSSISLPMTIPALSPSFSQYYPIYPYSYHYYSSFPPSLASYQLSSSLPSNYHYNFHPHYHYTSPLYSTYYPHPPLSSSPSDHINNSSSNYANENNNENDSSDNNNSNNINNNNDNNNNSNGNESES
ncbi:unnamed protein product [Cunninghamella blakesleeana]